MSCLAGGGSMLIHRPRTGASVALDFNVEAPRRAHARMYRLAEGRSSDLFPWRAVEGDANVHGHLAVAVPGSVAGLALALERWGTLDLRDAVAPAARLARRGVPVDWYLGGRDRDVRGGARAVSGSGEDVPPRRSLAAASGASRARRPRPLSGARPDPRAHRQGGPERFLPRGDRRGHRGGAPARRRRRGSHGPRALSRPGDQAARRELSRRDASRDAGRHRLRDGARDAEHPGVLRPGLCGPHDGARRRIFARRLSGSRSRIASAGSATRRGSTRRGARSAGRRMLGRSPRGFARTAGVTRGAAWIPGASRAAAARHARRDPRAGSTGDCTTQVCAVDGDRTLVSLTHTAVSLFGSKVVVPETGLLLRTG